MPIDKNASIRSDDYESATYVYSLRDFANLESFLIVRKTHHLLTKQLSVVGIRIP